MRIKIISVGRIKDRYLLQGEEEFLKRMQNEHTIELEELAISGSLPPEQQKAKEAKKFLLLLREDDFLVLLDEQGKGITSSQFAEKLKVWMNQRASTLCFGIGGALGWDPSVKKRANFVLSLSPMTFTAQMTRLILIEQLYRGFSMLKGGAYHK